MPTEPPLSVRVAKDLKVVRDILVLLWCYNDDNQNEADEAIEAIDRVRAEIAASEKTKED